MQINSPSREGVSSPSRLRIADLDEDVRDIVYRAEWLSEESRNIFEGDNLLLLRMRWHFLGWLLVKGNNPKKNIGYNRRTAENFVKRLDQLHRVIWRMTDSRVYKLTHDHADKLTKWLANDIIRKSNDEPYTESSKRKFQNTLERYFEWVADQWDGEQWYPPRGMRFTDDEYDRPDQFTLKERYQLREASHQYRRLPDPTEVSPERRDEIEAYLSQRLGKPKDTVTAADWKHEGNGAKIPSLIGVALDTGLPPIEVERVKVGWVDLESGWVTIPREYASKERAQNKLPLTQPTIDVLRTWLHEREQYEKYDDTDLLWLNSEGNPYESGPLNRILNELCELADIETEGRKLSWYSFRHSLGDYMESIGDREEVKTQLRHETFEASEPYTNAPPEQRRFTLKLLQELESVAKEDNLDETDTDDYETLAEVFR